MSNYKTNFNKSGKVFRKEYDEPNEITIVESCDCESCCNCGSSNSGCNNCGCGNYGCSNEREDQREANPCVIAPTCEPRLLTLLTDAVFDETGINLCKTEVIIGDEVNINFEDYACAKALLIRVLDVCTEDSSVSYFECKPNCVRVKLENLVCKFEGKLVDNCGNILVTFIFYSSFLSSCSDKGKCDCECCKADTNPSSICTELYAPNGISYDGESPSINFIGFDTNSSCVRQGIVLQAEAKALKIYLGDSSCGQRYGNLIASIGLTLILRSVYTVEYKFAHEGISVPPKAMAIEEEEDRTCEKFVKGDLILKRAKPIEYDNCGKPVGPVITKCSNKNCYN